MKVDVVSRSNVVDVTIHLELEVGHKSQARSLAVGNVDKSVQLLTLDVLSRWSRLFVSSVNGIAYLIHNVLIVSDPHEDDARAGVNDSVIDLWAEVGLWDWLETKLDNRY